MKLKKLENYLEFIKTAQKCGGEVFFNSAEGDRLNLKSTFCRYLFASVCGDREFLAGGEIVCSDDADYQILASYLVGGTVAKEAANEAI
ncbi:MAG: polya polymerase [Lachnospiraceae bacterium]|nr:polya polymerase [Lachnospiraceae bacterium]